MLYHPQSVSSTYILKEIEQMLGESAIDVIKKSKMKTLGEDSSQEFKSGLYTNAFLVQNSLKIVPADDFDMIDKTKKIVGEKNQSIE